MQLLADPDLMPLEIGAAAYLQKTFAVEAGKSAGPQLPEVISLLDNKMILGFAAPSKPAAHATGEEAKEQTGFLFVYDASGKKELLQKLEADAREKNKSSKKFSKYDFAGTPVEVEEEADTKKTYTAYAGSYYISTNRKDLAEDLITRYAGSDAPAASLTRRAEYQDSRKYADANACIEMFGVMPDLTKLVPEDPKNPTASKIVRGLHLEKIHAFTLTIDLNGEATRTRGALLGDASPGTIFDLFGNSAADFATLATIGTSPDFQVSRLNPAGLYKYVLGAVQGSLPPQQDASLKATQAMAQTYLGMPLGDALGLLTGEYAQASYFTADGTSETLFAVAIEKPEDVLRILRATLGSFILSEDSAGTTTFLDFTYPYKDPVSGTDRRKFYYVAVTPHMVLAAPRKVMVRDAIARVNATQGTPQGVLASPEFAQMRSSLPANLSGMSAADFRQIPWDKILANYIEQRDELARKSKPTEPPPNLDWLKLVKSDVLTRHLHVSVGGWWKDSNGVYFDSSFQ